MGLYYQAVLSSLLLNFLPDLPRTFFFTPQYPILFFFTLAFTFSLSFFHITADFQQVKRKKIYSFALSGQCTFFFFFPHKSPHFLWGLSSRTDRSLPQFQRWWRQHWWLNDTRKVATLYLYCGSSDSCFQLTIWCMACTHPIDTSPSSLNITQNNH